MSNRYCTVEFPVHSDAPLEESAQRLAATRPLLGPGSDFVEVRSPTCPPHDSIAELLAPDAAWHALHGTGAECRAAPPPPGQRNADLRDAGRRPARDICARPLRRPVCETYWCTRSCGVG